MIGHPGDERALSPVVGVILLVAIVVLLSTVAAGMILDFSEKREPAPEVVMSLEPSESNTDEFVLVHKNGDNLDGDKVELLGVADPETMNGETFTAGSEHRVEPTAETVTVLYHGEHGSSYTLREFSITLDDSGLTLPEADEGCAWVDAESDGGTDPVKVDGLVVDCDVTTEEVVEVLDGGAIIGDTESELKSLDVDDGTLYGDATAEDVINVQDGAVYGTVVSNTADVKIDNSYVNESLSGEKIVEVINGGTVGGDAVSDTKAVKVLSGSTVEGDAVSNADQAKVTSATVKGNVTGDTVDLDDATIEGDVYVDSGDFDCTDSTIDGQSCADYTPKDPDDY